MKTKFSKYGSLFVMVFLIIFVTACSSDDDSSGGDDQNDTVLHEPILLDCDYFHEDRVLINDPDAPIDYIISCRADVTADLTIEPGVVIAFEEDASLSLREGSSLKMEGTEGSPIVLTGVEPDKGLWRGMLIESNKESNSMKYVTIEYAGSNNTSSSGGMSPAGLQVARDGSVTIDHCTFQHCQDNGLFWTSSKHISITNSVFTKNDYPMKTNGNNQIKLYNNTNTYIGNENDYVLLEYPGMDNDNKEITWHKIDVPYYITTRIYNRFDIKRADLIIEPGVEVIVATSGTHMRIMSDGGSIRAIGTPEEPIIFRGKNDVKGSWSHILIASSSALNEIAYMNIKNAGDLTSTPSGALRLQYGAYLNVHDVKFVNNVKYAISMLYQGGMSYPVIAYDNLTLDATPLMFGNKNDNELGDPNDPNSGI